MGTIRRIALVVCVGAFLFTGYRILSPLLAYQAATDEYQSLAAMIHPPVDKPREPSTPEDVRYQSPIDFEALFAINPDIIGWIQIPGTVVDYPVVQVWDNDTYLHTTFEGRRNASGAIFADYRSASDFSDPNTLIYGHKMKNGTMFALLTDYLQPSFYEAHPTLTVYTSDAEYHYEIFSVYVTAPDDPAYTLDYPDADSFADYLDEVKARSQMHTDVAVDATDVIITLSTCDYQFEDARLVVHAKRVRVGDKNVL